MESEPRSRNIARRVSGTHVRRLLLSTTVLTGSALLMLPGQALAVCAPPAGGAGVPPAGTVVTCSGATVNQNGTTGYGTGAESGLTINVQTGASVTGTNRAINVGASNEVNVFGTVTGGTQRTVSVSSGSTVNNSGTITGVSPLVIVGDFTSTVNNTASGVIGSTNPDSGTVQVVLAVNNFGTISGRKAVVDALNVTNSGLIAGANTPNAFSVPGIGIDDARNVTNNATGTISGFVGIRTTGVSAAANIFNAGTVTGASGTAIVLDTFGGNDTLTIAPTSVINGNVVAAPGTSFSPPSGNTNIFQLGGSGNGTFNVSEIGPAAKYQAFSTFNKVGDSTWTLTGSGAQNWTISEGTLVGDTTSLQGPAITNNAALVFNQSFDGTYVGVVSGTGSLTKEGVGVLALSGNNTYTGATNVNAGTLRAAIANATSASSAYTVGSGATFDLNNFNQTIGSLAGGGNVTLGSATLTTGGDNTSTTFSGVASGTGGLTKNGAGTFTMTGNNTYSGPTTVNAGTLLVNGSNGSSPFTVNNGATLGGTGTIGTTVVNNGGTLAAGASIGTLNVNGNLTLNPGSNYVVEVSPTAADRINVTGIVNLAGSVTAMFSGSFSGGGCGSSNRYTILSSSQRIGTFSGLNTIGLPTFLSASLDYTPTDALLVTVTSNVSILGNTRNQKAVAGALDARFNGGCNTFPGLASLTQAQIPAALDQLSGEAHASTAGVLVDESLHVRNAVLGRLRQVSYGGNTSMASLTVGGPQVAFADDVLSDSHPLVSEGWMGALAYAKSPIVTKAPLKAPEASRDIVFWAHGFGAAGRFDTDANAATLRRTLAGFISGVDARVGANGRAGIAAGYTGSRNNLDGRGSGNVETGHIAAYGGWSFGSINLRAGGAYAFHAIDTERTALFPGFADRLTARYDGGTGQVFGEVGYGFAFGNVAVEPFAGGAWVRLDTDGATERGGAAALNVAASSFEVGYSTLGVRAASLIPVGDGMVLIPRASAAWQHAFGRVTPEATLAFQTTPAIPFVIGGVPIARDALLAEAGLDLAIGRNATLGVSYVGQLARNVADHAAKGKFSWKF